MKPLPGMLLALCACGGPIELEPHEGTAFDDIDPDGVCDHFRVEFELACDDTFPQLTCMEECVAEGGSDAGVFLDFEDCWHSAGEITCDALEACLLQSGASCVPR